MSLPNSIPKFPNFQHSPQPFFPKFPKCLSFPPDIKNRLCQMAHRFLDFFWKFWNRLFFVFFAIIGIFEMFGYFGNLYTFDSILFLVLTLVPRLLFVVALILAAVLVFVLVLWQ